jgi:hypothetical protein
VICAENEYFKPDRRCCAAGKCPLMTTDYARFNVIKSGFMDPGLGQNLQRHPLFSQSQFRARLQNAIFHSLKDLHNCRLLKSWQDVISAHAFPPRDQNLVAPSLISV